MHLLHDGQAEFVGGAARVTTAHDAAGNLIHLDNTFGYDPAGRETGQVSANATRTSTIYDAAGRITGVLHRDPSGTVVEGFSYAYDAAGRRIRVIELGGVGGWDGLSVEEWAELSLGNWSQMTLTGDELARVTWTYDPTSQLLSEARSGVNDYRTTYVYDPSGNRLVEENLVDGRITATYDAANRLQRRAAFSGITTYSYDAAGNRRSVEEPSGDLTTYTWNAENQLVQVELPTDEVVT